MNIIRAYCCVARMLSRDVELVSERTGVKSFKRCNGVDTALYKTYIFHGQIGIAGHTSLHYVQSIIQPVICVIMVQT